jgi:peptidase M49-like protein
MTRLRPSISILIILLFSFSPVLSQKKSATSGDPEMAKKIARFAPTVLTANTAKLTAKDKLALTRIIQAAKLLDPLFLRQVWSGNDALEKKLLADTTSVGRQRLHYFYINDGPWSRLDNNEPFIEGVPKEKPPQAAAYPDDMTKEEFNSWVQELSESEKQKATGFFWVIRRGPDRKLMSVPYSQAYREYLEPAAKLLREAAALTTNATLKTFLSKRADALGTDDYYESDVAWMDLDAPIDVTFGPYETYEDELFSYKASFEAYVTLRDDAESAKLAKFSRYLQELENNLPMDPSYRNPKLGAASPIRVVNEVFSSGEGNDGVQTAAYNLPNDERVVKEKGSKRVMLKNVQDAKFSKTLIPISRVVLEPAERTSLSFDSFFTHILCHELMHGLGPHNISVGGEQTTVRKQLKDLYSAIEEAKADVTGLWALQYMIDHNIIDKSMEKTLYITYLASMFRSVRFGITEAHGKGVAMQFNYLVDEDAIKYNDGSGTFSVDHEKFKAGVTKLTRDLLTLEAEGSYEKAKAILDKFAVIRPPMQQALDKLKNVPVDIEPVFPMAK